MFPAAVHDQLLREVDVAGRARAVEGTAEHVEVLGLEPVQPDVLPDSPAAWSSSCHRGSTANGKSMASSRCRTADRRRRAVAPRRNR